MASLVYERENCGDAMQVPIQMGTKMAAGNQQKHLSLSFATKKSVNLSLQEIKNVTIIFFSYYKNCSHSQNPRNKSLF